MKVKVAVSNDSLPPLVERSKGYGGSIATHLSKPCCPIVVNTSKTYCGVENNPLISSYVFTHIPALSDCVSCYFAYMSRRILSSGRS